MRPVTDRSTLLVRKRLDPTCRDQGRRKREDEEGGGKREEEEGRGSGKRKAVRGEEGGKRGRQKRKEGESKLTLSKRRTRSKAEATLTPSGRTRGVDLNSGRWLLKTFRGIFPRT
jgi:hypothetical protein